MLNIVVTRRARLCVAAALAIACTRDLEAPTARTAPTGPGVRVAGVVEITFRDIGSPNMTSSAIVGSTVAEVEALRAAQTLRGPAGQPRFNLTIPQITTGVPGDQTIQIRLDANGASSTETASTRYFHATYDVRNAQLNGTPFNTDRHNLTFLAVGATGRTIGDSPVTVFNNSGGTPVNPDLTHQLKPSGLVELNGADAVVPVSPDILQVFTEAEISTFVSAAEPADVTNVFPYGFMVHNRATPTTSRTLTADPPPDQFDGVVTFAYRMPLQTPSTNDPTTITVLMLALDDSQVRVTQSLEEQTVAGGTAVSQRAASLTATQIRLLGGVSLGATPTGPDTLFCSVRTTGPANAPTSHLVKGEDFVSLDPNPFASDGSGSHIARDARIHATFGATVENPTSSNFVVRGLVSGQQFRGGTYTGSGTTTVSTPAQAEPGAFIPGENVEVALTTGLACPRTWVGRLTVAATAGTGQLSAASQVATGTVPRAVAVGDFDRDGNLDLAVANFASNTITIEYGDGAGGFGQRTLTVPVTPGNGPTAIVAGDFNGDGILDLATADVTSNDVIVVLGNPDGSFGSARSFASGAVGTAQMATGDFNGDGALDLVVAKATGVTILMGNGDGTFRTPTTIAVSGAAAVAIGDLNQDGRLDFVVSLAATGVVPFLGNGDGTFTQEPTIPLTFAGAAVALGDLNGDGHLDVAVGLLLGGVAVALGNGDGTFGSTTELTGLPTVAVGAVAMADMNHDGHLDLVVSQPNVLSVFLNSGGFGTHSEFVYDGATATPMTTVDLNRDGALDVVIPNNVGNSTHVTVFHGIP